ncbi:hypothetical protein [Brevibacillus sp. AY1]|uniref:hypothetical protein n=1 Tax=Brevibacillus sp. AY1 TaxID=2807621 RepID=UPI00245791A5|nr:hypothetical protein [Brevibacillus sp. AY1]MDH4619237.1 hypothetical protein [Brevibacillus sp. AY1]
MASVEDISGDENPTEVRIDSVTKTDGNALTGGESTVRVHLSITGTVTEGDWVEIKTASGAIFDGAGNLMADHESTGEKSLHQPLAYTWDEATDTITLHGIQVDKRTGDTGVRLVAPSNGGLERISRQP